MSTDITLLPLGDQASALAGLAGIAEICPSLPGAHITVGHIVDTTISVQLEHPSDLELWRTALGVPPTEVSIVRNRLRFNAVVGGVDCEVWASTEIAALAKAVAA